MFSQLLDIKHSPGLEEVTIVSEVFFPTRLHHFISLLLLDLPMINTDMSELEGPMPSESFTHSRGVSKGEGEWGCDTPHRYRVPVSHFMMTQALH